MDPSILESFRVLPVIAARDADTTVELCRALWRGGTRAVEITLRTEAAIDSIRAVRAALPELRVGSGTVTDAADLRRAIDAGCDFHVSPGLSPGLLRAAAESGADFLPGVATPSDIMQGMESGLRCFKLFPAVAAGGLALLKSLAGPFPGLRFCPTGGLDEANFRDFLALPNVVCCGGSWLVSDELVAAGQWRRIEILARAAMAA